jgi:DNA replication protein DnaC
MNKKNKKKYCEFCDHSGIVHNRHFQEEGEAPLAPCPKCVLPQCKCGGEPPYYYSENGSIVDCYCRETRIHIETINRLYKDSRIDKKYQWKLLNDFRTDTSSAAKTVWSAAREIVFGFPNISKGLFLWGNPGTGKTLISAIILTELIRHYGISGKMIKISRGFFQQIKSTFNENSENYGKSADIEHALANTDILVVDDFGVQRDTEWERETLYNLVDARYEAEKFTIFTSNYNPTETIKDQRVLSRLKEMCRFINLSGEDQRESV